MHVPIWEGRGSPHEAACKSRQVEKVLWAATHQHNFTYGWCYTAARNITSYFYCLDPLSEWHNSRPPSMTVKFGLVSPVSAWFPHHTTQPGSNYSFPLLFIHSLFCFLQPSSWKEKKTNKREKTKTNQDQTAITFCCHKSKHKRKGFPFSGCLDHSYFWL